jgi:hypothetical protein
MKDTERRKTVFSFWVNMKFTKTNPIQEVRLRKEFVAYSGSCYNSMPGRSSKQQCPNTNRISGPWLQFLGLIRRDAHL